MELDRFNASPADVAGFYASKPAAKVKPKHGPAKAAAKVTRLLPRHGEGDRFVKGPIPMDWIRIASRCGHRGEAVALLVWFAAGLQKSNPCKLTQKVLAELHVNPRTARRILERFAEAGIVEVEFHRGRAPRVTILSPPTEARQ